MGEKIATVSRDVRVVHPWSFSYYDAFLGLMKEYSGEMDRWRIDDSAFKDGSDWIDVLHNKSDDEQVNVVSPFWIAPLPVDRSLAKPFFAMEQLGNALTHENSERRRLADELIGIAPYLEMRQDEVTPGSGEAVTAEMLAKSLKAHGYTKIATLDIHSYLAASFIEKEGLEHVNFTAVPLFVDRGQERGIIVPGKTKIGALDLGALQSCWHAANLAGIPLTDLVVFRKQRGGHNVVDDSTLLYGDPKGSDIVLIDDLQDTGESVGVTSNGLKKAGCGKIHVMLTHGVLSHPARQNIEENLKSGRSKKERATYRESTYTTETERTY